jgi:hypothetical protein
MRRVLGNPTDLGYAQLDVFALKSDGFGGSDVFTRVRVDDARECVFAVTKAPDLTNYGEVAVFAEQLKFFLPPAQSGSTGTFRFLQELDPEGLGRAQEIKLTGSADEAIRKALETRGGIAFFVQFPDAQNPRFKMIQDLGGHVVPVIDRAILAQEVDGQRIYHAQETQVTNTRWLRASPKVVTACTPLVLFTGAPETIKDKTERQNHAESHLEHSRLPATGNAAKGYAVRAPDEAYEATVGGQRGSAGETSGRRAGAGKTPFGTRQGNRCGALSAGQGRHRGHDREGQTAQRDRQPMTSTAPSRIDATGRHRQTLWRSVAEPAIRAP